jgi:hypothetical protein
VLSSLPNNDNKLIFPGFFQTETYT